MRQHKYRAYNKRLKKMEQVIAIELDPELGGVEVWGKDYVNYETLEHEADRDFWPWDDCEVMQFVGKTDANSIEIYEGDILAFEIGHPVAGYVERSGATWIINGATSLNLNTESKILGVIGNIFMSILN